MAPLSPMVVQERHEVVTVASGAVAQAIDSLPASAEPLLLGPLTRGTKSAPPRESA